MTEALETTERGIGDNLPPEPLDELEGELAQATGPLKDRIRELAEAVETSSDEIESDDAESAATLLAGMVNEEIAELEAKQKDTRAPYAAAVKVINAHYNAVIAPLIECKHTLAGRLRVRLIKKDDERREREVKARKAAEEAAAKARTAEDLERAEELARKAKEEAAPVHAESDYGQVAYLRVEKKWRVVDEKSIPPAYWMLNKTAIGKACKAGIPIPGVEFYEDRGLSVRK